MATLHFTLMSGEFDTVSFSVDTATLIDKESQAMRQEVAEELHKYAAVKVAEGAAGSRQVLHMMAATPTKWMRYVPATSTSEIAGDEKLHRFSIVVLDVLTRFLPHGKPGGNWSNVAQAVYHEADTVEEAGYMLRFITSSQMEEQTFLYSDNCWIREKRRKTAADAEDRRSDGQAPGCMMSCMVCEESLLSWAVAKGPLFDPDFQQSIAGLVLLKYLDLKLKEAGAGEQEEVYEKAKQKVISLQDAHLGTDETSYYFQDGNGGPYAARDLGFNIGWPAIVRVSKLEVELEAAKSRIRELEEQLASS